MNRITLLTVFAAIFVTMLGFTVKATLQRSVLDNGHLISDPWFQATLVDTYLGFLTFYLWVAWKESTMIARATWFVLIMTLGNMAMAAYVFWQLWKLEPGQPLHHAWTRRNVILG